VTTPNLAAAPLGRGASDTEHPKPLPVGTYLCVVQGLPRQDRSSRAQTEFLEFTLRPIRASRDVDADALTAIGGFQNRITADERDLTHKMIDRLSGGEKAWLST
jgi:hypothetical protein